jgi:ribonuclease P protein component
MVFARAWRRKAAAGFSPSAGRTGASGSVRNVDARSVVVERLRRRADFRVAASGMRAAGRSFVLQARSRGDQGAVRIGFTVARQVGDAVERNRVRRRLREIVRVSMAAAGGGLCPGHDYVLIGRRPALGAPFGEMMRDLDAALARVHTQVHAQASADGRGGTGGAHAEPLHEAGSPSRPRPRRRNRNEPLKVPARPTEPPRHEH